MRRTLIPLAFTLLALPGLAAAEAPDACSLITMDEVNNFAAKSASKTRARAIDRGSECAYMDGRQNAILTVSVKESKAPKAELDHEADNLQKIYRTTVKAAEVGESGFFLSANKQLHFRKGKLLVLVFFSRPANANPVDTLAAAKIVESRLK